MRPRVCWVLWDVKDTLLKVRRSVGEQYCSEAARLGLQLPPHQVESAFRQAYRRQARLYPNYGVAQGLGGQRWWVAVVRDTFGQCGVQDSGLLDKLALNLYHNFKNAENWEVFPDSHEVLQTCRDMGLKLGVVSNFDNRLEGILRGCGLFHHFSFLLTSEGAKVAKPDAAIFHQALRYCCAPPASVAHVGDHYSNDYLAACSVGIQGYLLDRAADLSSSRQQQPDVPAQFRIRSLEELPARLQQTADQ